MPKSKGIELFGGIAKRFLAALEEGDRFACQVAGVSSLTEIMSLVLPSDYAFELPV